MAGFLGYDRKSTVMTPKEQYEARKAERKKRDMDFKAKDEMTIDMLDRFVTAVERIADALEKRINA